MKKIKEFLLLFLPFLVFTALPIIVFLTAKDGGIYFIGNSYYLKLMLQDPLMRKMLFYTFGIGSLYAAIPIIILAILRTFIKPMKRKLVYFIGLPTATVTAFLALWVENSRSFGVPVGIYDPHYLVDSVLPPITASISIYHVFFAVQTAFLLMLIYWIIETAVLKIKNR